MSAVTPVASEMQSFLQLTAIRELVVEQVGARLTSDSALVTRFWYQIVSEATDVTLFYGCIRWMGRKFVFAEFVSGETLEELVKRSDPASCEREIPLFCKLLDAFEGNAIAPAPGADDFELLDFGIARVTKPEIAKAHGATLAGPGGGWAEEIYNGTPDISRVLKEFCQDLLFPKPDLPAPPAAPEPARKGTPAWAIAIATAALVLLILFGIGRFLSGRTAPAGLVVPASTRAAAAGPAEPALPSGPAPEGTVTVARGPKPLRQTPPPYPETARRQWITGDIDVELALGSDGAVESARILSGETALAEGLAASLAQWTFRPLRAKGKPVTGSVQLTLRYDLKPLP